MDISPIFTVISASARDESLQRARAELAILAVECFLKSGEELSTLDRAVSSDGSTDDSAESHGADEAVAVSLLLLIGGQLASAIVDLFGDGRQYAAAALLRQIVEIEYLAWAFESRHGDAQRWLDSTREDRRDFFQPWKLRKAAEEGRFRGTDYRYHCELGGHPVPGATILLTANQRLRELFVVDLLGHLGRIWDHLVRWAEESEHGGPILRRRRLMLDRFVAWKTADPLASLPPPPEQQS